MFLNYLPREMIEVLELTIIFSGLVGTILFLLFTADKPNTKNLYMKKARWLHFFSFYAILKFQI